MRIVSIAGSGVLSFDRFRLDLSDRLTFIVGPNGAGKSNLTRLLGVCQRAVECSDGAAGDMPTLSCSYEYLPQAASASQRRYAQMAGPSLVNPAGNRTVTLARALRVILRRALRQTSDIRLLPSGGVSWNSSETTFTEGAEARLPYLLLSLKNGGPAERAQYQRFRELFTEFTQGQACEIRLMQAPQSSGPNGEPSPPAQVPAVWVTVDVVTDPADLVPEVPVEFAGAGA